VSAAPGVQVSSVVARRRRQTGVIPATMFVPAITLRGPHGAAVEVSSLAEFESVFGGPVASSIAHAELKAAFAEGAPRAYVARIVGPSPVFSSLNLSNGSGTALTVTARQYGSYFNDATVAVAASGGNFVLTIVEPDGSTIVSPSLADLAEAVAWGADLENYVITSSGSTDPVTAAAANLTSGDDDAANITETQRDTARALFAKNLGCGHIHEPGLTTTAGALKLMAHAAANNRLAFVDVNEGVTVANSVTHADSLRDQPGALRSKLNRSWARVRGAVTGTTDLVSFSALELGMLGRNDAAGVPVGQPAAGGFGKPNGALSLETEYSDAERATLNTGHVNVAVAADDEILGYGNRSLSTTQGEKLFSQARTRMVIQAQAEHAGRAYVHRLVDGEGRVLGEFLKDLIAICEQHRKDGNLYGAAADAYRVQVFEVNTDENLLEGVLNAAIDILPSGAAEFVRINITSYADSIGA